MKFGFMCVLLVIASAITISLGSYFDLIDNAFLKWWWYVGGVLASWFSYRVMVYAAR